LREVSTGLPTKTASKTTQKRPKNGHALLDPQRGQVVCQVVMGGRRGRCLARLWRDDGAGQHGVGNDRLAAEGGEVRDDDAGSVRG